MTRLTFVLALLTLACGAETPAPTCIVGRSASCACPGGAQGAQVCRPDGTFDVCVCPDASVPVDTAVVDVPGVDALADAGGDTGPADTGADVPQADVDPRCAHAPGTVLCEPGACWNLLTSNGRIPATNCGACNRPCPPTAPACIAGRCTEASDGG